jgi:hypothetical protein
MFKYNKINWKYVRMPCDVVYRYNEAGEKIRVSKRTGYRIPLAPIADSTIDYTKRSEYKRIFIDYHIYTDLLVNKI